MVCPFIIVVAFFWILSRMSLSIWLVVQLGGHLHLQVLFCRADFQLSATQNVLVCGIVLLQVQEFALLLTEHDEVPVTQLVEISLVGSMSFCHTSHSIWFCVTGSLANLKWVQSTQSPTSLIKMLNRTGPSTDSRGTLLVTDLQLHLVPLTDQHLLGPAIQIVLCQLHCFLIQQVHHQLLYKDLVGDCKRSN